MTNLIDSLAKCRICGNIIFTNNVQCTYCKAMINDLSDVHKEALK